MNAFPRSGRGARSIAGLALAAGLAAAGAQAAELRMLSAGAVELGLTPALAAFQRETGHTVQVSFAAAPAIAPQFTAGPGYDLVIAPPAVLDALARAGAIGKERVPIGKVGIGVAIRSGADAPDITSVETLKQALLSAESVVFNRASTGLYVETLLARLGIADAVNAKATRYGDGASVMRHLLAGNKPHEFGLGAITEIVLFKDQGLKLVGPLPAAVQNTTSYIAAPGAAAKDQVRADATATLLHHLDGAAARAAFANAGIEPIR
ncbi:MAG: substrate-binding domain-containing protein [Caldimonas sp.]